MVKIVFMGPPGGGKTSIIRAFKGEDVQAILNDPSEPTHWDEESYEHIDFFLRIVDLGGQGSYVDEWHKEREYEVFAKVDAIVYVVDASDRKMAGRAENHLRRVIHSAAKHTGSDARIYMFLHKVDLLSWEGEGSIGRGLPAASSLRDRLVYVFDVEGHREMLKGVYETSICDYSSNRAMRIVLNDVMPEYRKYREAFSKVIEKAPMIETIQLIAPEKGVVVAEATQPAGRRVGRGEGVRKPLTLLVRNIEDAVRSIDGGSELDYDTMKTSKGKFTFVKNLEGRYLIVVESKEQTSEHSFQSTVAGLLRMMKDIGKLLQPSSGS